ncbi:hypothetical protein LTR56_009416 [Elasticomyces elasticus]|nr:hypothetical protein LTR56_009416 [Elasticomyces elasticus]KAK3645850.1 hypothetical protein LTR22_014516 [Elasticomyces elasticus]KAK4931063.1 hypothetical protein LTR49_002478 [Elasticomyces elasticus]KAK5765530.1 hypothetical protein LTS12_004281 [Elasticomyces elasticus]
MPPNRKSTGPRAVPTRQSSNSQATLSFHGKQNKVTKAGVTPASTKAGKKDATLLEDAARAVVKTETIDLEDDEPTAAEAPIEQTVEEEAQTLEKPVNRSADEILGGRAPESDAGTAGGKGAGWVGDEQTEARKISDTQIKRYWRQKEEERLAPRVHQEGITVFEKVLREWDMSGQYGPCIGIARLKRWKRANLLGLKPPIEVLAVILKEMEAGNTKSQRAHVDELMSSKFGIET